MKGNWWNICTCWLVIVVTIEVQLNCLMYLPLFKQSV
jgi:hypothetical protein